MSIRYQAFAITGAANSTVYDSGIESTQAEPKTIRAVWLHVSGWAGNRAELWRDQSREAQLYDYLVPTEESTGGANTQKVTNRVARFEFNLSLDIGETFKAALNCGATAKNLFGAYEYEVPE